MGILNCLAAGLICLGTTLAQAKETNVEIKVSIQREETEHATKVLRADGSHWFRRRIFFFDTKSLKLFRRGLVLRARLKEEGDDDVTAKIRPIARQKVGDQWLKLQGFKCEDDRAHHKSVFACSLTEQRRASEILDVIRGKQELGPLYSKNQRQFALEFASWGTKGDFEELLALGPVAATGWSLQLKEIDYPVHVEHWQLPQHLAMLEVSVRVPESKVEETEVKLAQFLRERKIDPSDSQETKTRFALEYFTRRASAPRTVPRDLAPANF